MNDWVKIISYTNPYEAEIRKQLLQNAGIDAVVVNARDSLFLVGDVELYVKKEEEKEALMLLEQFEGLTKINSFILQKPILNFKSFLKEKGIDTILKEKESNKYIFENYELYVENEKINEVLPYLTGEKIDTWTKVALCNTVRQARYRIELLDVKGIESFVIKKRDSDFHLEDISIYVENAKADLAKEILSKLEDWDKIREYDDFKNAELKEDILGKNGIRAIIEQKNQKYILYVLKAKKDAALKTLALTTEWVEALTYNSFIDAESTVLLLEENKIDASILTIRDSVFIIGGYAVYVEKKNLTKALDLIANAKGGVISE